MCSVASIVFLLAYVGFAQTFFLKVKASTAASVPAEQLQACTYYMSPTGSDTNSGTIQAPWKHLQKAFETLTAGQVACLRSGTYEPAGAYDTPSYRQTMLRSGEPGNPIVIQNYSGETAIVLGLVVVRGNYLKLCGTPPSGGLVFQGRLGPDASGGEGKGGGEVWLDKCRNVVV